MQPKTAFTRVLVVEDSPVMRDLLVSIFQGAGGLQVVGTASNGTEAVRLARRLRPDVITMDIYMPEMDGYEATRQIMSEAPSPIVIISSSLTKDEQEFTFNALQAGALSVAKKPTMLDPPETYQNLISQIKLMSEVKVVRRWHKAVAVPAGPHAPVVAPSVPAGRRSKINLIAIAASTGGPGALAAILGQFPADFPVPILVVQHVTPGFGEGLSNWLNGQTALEVRAARAGDEPCPGQALIAPDHHHMEVNNLGLIALKKALPHEKLCPSADYLFHSVAQVYGPTAIGVILTGMGRDGAEGLLAMHATGATTIAQDAESCVVFGMPAAAIELKSVDQITSLRHIASTLTSLL
jgi:two-component system chemotaxis response regulator CheB